ncbi:MAG: hypothetical protein OEW87_10685 [Flavobacteriaceae bacterium]|nr:hypothetical protein [Flavobacteriaceae bacterium]
MAAERSRIPCKKIDLSGMWYMEFYKDAVESIRLATWSDDEVPVKMSNYITSDMYGFKINKVNGNYKVISNLDTDNHISDITIKIGDNIRVAEETGGSFCSLEITGTKTVDGVKTIINEYLLILATNGNFAQILFGGKSDYNDGEGFGIDLSIFAIGNITKIQKFKPEIKSQLLMD